MFDVTLNLCGFAEKSEFWHNDMRFAFFNIIQDKRGISIG